MSVCVGGSRDGGDDDVVVVVAIISMGFLYPVEYNSRLFYYECLCACISASHTNNAIRMKKKVKHHFHKSVL